MQIDWVTVAAQIVNFLVLVWLLQRFLYGPITRAMKRREERIAERLDGAEKLRQEAESEAQKFRSMQEGIEKHREETLEETRNEAKELQKKLEEEARNSVNEEREAWRRGIAKEQASFLQDFRRLAERHVYDVARSALSDLANAELETQVVPRFIDELGKLERPEADKIAEAAKEADGLIVIESAFEMPSCAKEKITKAVHDLILDGAAVDYRQSADLALGLRLRARGRSVEWSLNAYLDRLEETLAAELEKLQPSDEQAAA